MPHVNNTKRWVDNFPNLLLIKFRNFPAGVGVVNQPLRLFQDGAYELLANFRNCLLKIVSFYGLKVV